MMEWSLGLFFTGLLGLPEDDFIGCWNRILHTGIRCHCQQTHFTQNKCGEANFIAISSESFYSHITAITTQTILVHSNWCLPIFLLIQIQRVMRSHFDLLHWRKQDHRYHSKGTSPWRKRGNAGRKAISASDLEMCMNNFSYINIWVLFSVVNLHRHFPQLSTRVFNWFSDIQFTEITSHSLGVSNCS